MIPNPTGEIQKADGSWKIKTELSVAFGGFDAQCIEAFSQRTRTACTASADNADIVLAKDASFKPEEYAITVAPARVTVTAASEAGVIHALTTLYVHISGDAVPCFTLKDAPRYAYRGLLFDCARHFFSVDEVKKIVEQIALVKLNKLHWHLTDDQGWRVEIKAYPELTAGIEHYTQEEIKDIVRFAAQRGIEVIPEIDMPGHVASAVHVLPWLSCAGKQIKRPTAGGIYKAILCAGKESTYDFACKVFDEVAALFPSPYVHIGGDEAPKAEWKECADCIAKLKEIGSDNFEDLQGHFTARIAEHLAQKGKKPICWNETLKSAKTPEDLTIQYWIPGIDDEPLLKFHKQGRPVLYSDMFQLYLDYPHAVIPLQRVYDYVPAIGDEITADAPNNIGLEACLWAERVDTEEKLEHLLFPRTMALAENAWSREKSYEDFMRRLQPWVERMRENGVACTPLDEVAPQGEARINGLKGLMGMFAANPEPDDNRINPAEVFGGGGEGESFIHKFMSRFGIDPAIFGAK